MTHVLNVFVGRSKHNLGTNTYYRSNLTGAEVARCHAHACAALGLGEWMRYYEDEFGLTDEQARALSQVPSLAEAIVPAGYGRKRYPWTFEDTAWADVYLAVAAHGGRGLRLRAVGA